tara:strand:- start:88 stop:252 length:165 start_codon:yes stop_codon:yes gene_type:complete
MEKLIMNKHWDIAPHIAALDIATPVKPWRRPTKSAKRVKVSNNTKKIKSTNSTS